MLVRKLLTLALAAALGLTLAACRTSNTPSTGRPSPPNIQSAAVSTK